METTEKIKKLLNPIVKEWFEKYLKDFTPPQKISIPLIHQGKNVLISSPTGSGKTLSAFFSIINELTELASKNQLEDKVYCIYISPLRALNNDIEKNLKWPLNWINERLKENISEQLKNELEVLKEKRKIAKKNKNQKEYSELNEKIKELRKQLRKLEKEDIIRIMVRTSDTTESKKSSMLKKPPHIVITTPESLAIMLNSPKFREKLFDVKWVVIDELHALAENKRGTHLILSLERLSYWVKNKNNRDFVRIGLSATIHPLEEVAKFLFGEREGFIIDVNYLKKIDLKVLSPVDDYLIDSNLFQKKLYELLDKLIQEHKTTLIFTNTRSGAESVAYHLKLYFPDKYNENNVMVHHSSLSREERLYVEDKLKKGELKVVCSSSSLELGVDIGEIDLVILLSSPKSVNRALQRVGRSGHKLHEVSKGRFLALDWDDLVENTILVYNAINKKLDRVKIIKNALDVLIQHLLGMALEKEWDIDEAYNLITSTYSYKNLSKEDFILALKYLANQLDYNLEEGNYYGKIFLDLENNRFRARKGKTRIIYLLNLGTIPDEANIPVINKLTKKPIGSVEEEFVDYLKKGDVFVLSGKKWRFLYFRGGKLVVEPAEEAKVTIPSWFSEQLPLSYDLAISIQEFREELKNKIVNLKKKEEKKELINYIKTKYNLDENSAKSILNYFEEQKKLSIIPGKDLLIEFFKREEGGKTYYVYVFHSLIGKKANRALAYYVAEVIKDLFIVVPRIYIHDNGFALEFDKLVELDENLIKNIFLQDKEEIIEKIKNSLKDTFLLKRIFRHVATRSFLILRRYMGKKRSVEQQIRLSLNLVKLMPFIPVLEKETYREILEDKMDIENLLDYLDSFENGKRKILVKKLKFISPFSLNIIESESDVLSLGKERIKELYKKIKEYLSKYN
jgi:ATP-dependent Lhr-like helicase